MEDFHLLKNTDINKAFLKSISKVGESCNFEICGAATKQKLHFFKNLSKTPKESFFVSPQEYVNLYGNIEFFFHSHCLGGPKPSEADIDAAHELLRPFIIYSSLEKNFSFYCPKTQKSIYFSL